MSKNTVVALLWKKISEFDQYFRNAEKNSLKREGQASEISTRMKESVAFTGRLASTENKAGEIEPSESALAELVTNMSISLEMKKKLSTDILEDIGQMERTQNELEVLLRTLRARQNDGVAI